MELRIKTGSKDGKQMKQAAVVIPNWNGMKYLEGCLGSLCRQEGVSFDIILVDNGSEDGSLSFVRENFPEVNIIELHENTGFCHAVNEGIKNCRTKYVILLNNDTVCRPGFVKELVSAISARPGAFSCQAKMLDMKDPSLLDDAGDSYCALGWAFAEGRGKQEKRYVRERQIFASCAGAAIYRRSAFERTGLFDERHFAYLEDIDIGYRARLLGYKNYFIPGAAVEHAGSAASGSRHNEFKVHLSARNSVWLIRKNMPLWQRIINLPFLAAGFGIKAVFFVRKGLGAAYMRGLKEGLSADTGSWIEDEYKKGKIKRSQLFLNCVKIQFRLWLNMLRRPFV